MDHGPLRATSDGAIVSVVIDHPPTNLLDGSLLDGLRSLLDHLEREPSVRVVIFRSADPDFFVMHGDVELLVGLHPAYVPVVEANLAAATLQRMAAAPFVSMGLLDGAARGGGCELLSAMDVRFGTERAVIGQPEVAMGILPGAGGTARWPRLVTASTTAATRSASTSVTTTSAPWSANARHVAAPPAWLGRHLLFAGS